MDFHRVIARSGVEVGTSKTRRRGDDIHIALPNMPKKTPPDATPESPTLKSLTAEEDGALHPKDTVQTAGDRMREHDTGAWPVADERTLVGMIDGKNPDWAMGGHGHDPKDSPVSEIMKHELIFCFEDESCADARRKMDEHGMNFLPVVDREMKIVGIFTRDEVNEKPVVPPAVAEKSADAKSD